jgi:hypothetical protein
MFCIYRDKLLIYVWVWCAFGNLTTEVTEFFTEGTENDLALCSLCFFLCALCG